MKSLEELLAEASWSDRDDEHSERNRREWALLKLRQWWEPIAAGLPAWPYARADNREWRTRVAPQVIEVVREWRPLKLGRGVLLCAATGAGKSSSLVAKMWSVRRDLETIARREGGELPRLPSVLWTSEERLLAAAKAQRWGQGESELWRHAASVEVLILDELGFAGGDSGQMMGLIDSRYSSPRNAELTTCATTGHGKAGLIKRYGEALWRRLVERCDVVDLLSGEAP